MEVTKFGVIQIVAKDVIFQTKWTSFCKSIELDPSIVYSLEQLENRKSGIEEITMKIMDYWKAQASTAANIETLCEHLKQIGCTDSPAKIKALLEAQENSARRNDQKHLKNTLFNAHDKVDMT